ncbi:MAG: helix-turn-helix domain-containing protein [Bryobacteraceae bacterium]
MPRHPIAVKIHPRDVARIEELLRCGVRQVRVVLRALVLRQLANGSAAPQVAQSLPLSAKAVRQIAHRYQRGGLDRALYDRERPGVKPILDDAQKQRVIAMVRDDPPQGKSRWTVRLVAEEAVNRNLVPRAGRETIRLLLQQLNLKPWRKRNAPRGGI